MYDDENNYFSDVTKTHGKSDCTVFFPVVM